VADTYTEYVLLDELDPPEPIEAPFPDAPPRTSDETKLPELDIIATADLGDGEPPARRWHVQGLIPAGEITLLTGDGGTGKSLLALQLAFATATATDWIETLPTPGGVLFVSAEDSRDELHRRLSLIARRKNQRLSQVNELDLLSLAGRDAVFAAPSGKGNALAETPLFKALRARIEETRPALIVLDTLADLFDGDEIKRAQARRFIGMLRGLAIDFDVTVLLLAHPSLDGLKTDTGTSGSTAWSNSVRSRLYLKRPRVSEGDDEDTDARILTTKKSNYGRTGEERILRWRDGVFVPNFEAGSGAAVVSDAADEQTFLACLDEFERTGQDYSPSKSSTYAPAVFAASPTAKGLSKDRLAKAMARLFSRGAIHATEFGPASKRRKRIARGPAPKATNG
jgi:RecA-family ATPase